MNIHLYATDASGLDVVAGLTGARLSAVIVPENRLASEKIAALKARSPVQVHVQPRRGDVDDPLPPADVAVVWMYSQVFPPALLARYRGRMLNMHGGRIPEYRGGSVLQWAIVNGEPTLTVTWHSLVDAVDAGPIWAEQAIPIPEDWSAWDLRTAMISVGLALAPVALQRMTSGAAPLRIPDLAAGRVWPQRSARDGEFGPGLPERRVRDLVRALCPPWPGAVFVDRGTRTPIARVTDEDGPGRLAYVTAENRCVYLEPRP